MAIVVYIYETKKQARVPAFSSLFFVWLLLGDSQSFEWHLPKGNPQPFEGQGGHRKEINDNGKENKRQQKTPQTNFFGKSASKVQISTKTKENTRALSETEEHTRAERERKREKKSTRREVFICILFYRRLRWIYARRRRKSTAASLSLCKQLKSQRRRDIPFSGKCKRRQSPGERRRIRVPPVRKREK